MSMIILKILSWLLDLLVVCLEIRETVLEVLANLLRQFHPDPFDLRDLFHRRLSQRVEVPISAEKLFGFGLAYAGYIQYR